MTPIHFTHTARNYALDSENRIHGPEAARYGFRSGLVPGVGIYAAMTRAALEAFGPAWLPSGAASARLIKPVYDGDTIEITGSPAPAAINQSPDANTALEIEVRLDGELCASGRAWMPAAPPPPPDINDFPAHPLPPFDNRLAPTITVLKRGMEFGTRELTLDMPLAVRSFLTEMGDPSPIYRGATAQLHPAFAVAQANYIFRDNIALGPWIHVSSEVQHFAAPQHAESLSIRGSILEAFEKKGHEFVCADLAIFGNAASPLARLRHTAIVKLRDLA